MKTHVISKITLAFVEKPDVMHTFDLSLRRGGKNVIDWAVAEQPDDMHLTYRTKLKVVGVEYDDFVEEDAVIKGYELQVPRPKRNMEFAL